MSLNKKILTLLPTDGSLFFDELCAECESFATTLQIRRNLAVMRLSGKVKRYSQDRWRKVSNPPTNAVKKRQRHTTKHQRRIKVFFVQRPNIPVSCTNVTQDLGFKSFQHTQMLLRKMVQRGVLTSHGTNPTLYELRDGTVPESKPFGRDAAAGVDF